MTDKTKKSKADENFEHLAQFAGTVLFRERSKTGEFHFLGRNGCGDCAGISGLVITDEPGEADPRVFLEPITGKGEIGRCRIVAPLSALRAVVDRLDPPKAPAHANANKLNELLKAIEHLRGLAQSGEYFLAHVSTVNALQKVKSRLYDESHPLGERRDLANAMDALLGQLEPFSE